MTRHADASSDLLFGLLALQTGLIDQGALFTAFNSWTRSKDLPLAEFLAAQGVLDESQRRLVEGLVEQHLKRHGDRVDRSLAALAAARPVCDHLAALRDWDLNLSLAQAGKSACESEPEFDRTITFPVGVSSAGGRRFQLLRPHAEGGLGVVYLARDSELHREVALKQIQERIADDPGSRARFLAEAEITGGLEHPGVVPVYSLGSYPDGRPYYAMRFIKGESFKQAIAAFHSKKAEGLSLGARGLELHKLLQRFIDVCNTIDYAHGRGVLHRDVKPSNIIVGRHGETLVIDWGLAKAMGRSTSDSDTDEQTLVPSTSSGSAETLPGSALGTPAYMSPEQAAGDLDHLGPHSDVYSLGATLYCLLTGKPPFQEADFGLIRRAVQRGGFPPPRKQDASIDRALEAICLKALAPAPADRYGSARELAEDVERWTAGEPVDAYREPWTVRAGRWVKRHRVGVSASVAALVMAAACLGAATGLLLRAYKETGLQRDKARDRFEIAREAVDRFSTQVSESTELKAHGLESLRRELLNSAVDFYRRLAEQEASDPRLETDRGRAYTRLGALLRDLDRHDEARSAFDKAALIFRHLARAHRRIASYRRELAEILHRRGLLEHDTGHYDAAAPPHREALALRERLASESPGVLESQRDLASSLHALGRLERDSGQLAAAAPFYQKALALRQGLLQAHPDNSDLQDDLAWTEFNLGNLYVRMSRIDEGERAYQHCIALWERLTKAYPLVVSYPFILANGYNNLANLYENTGRLGAAEQFHRQSLTIHTRLVADHPLVPMYEEDLAKSLQNLARVEAQLGRTEAALTGFEEAIGIRGRLMSAHPEVLEYAANLAETYADLGDLERDRGHPRAALGWYDRALAPLSEVLRRQPHYVTATAYFKAIHVGRSRAWSDLNHPDKAERALRLAERIEVPQGTQLLRACRCLLRARAGDRSRAALEADELAADRALPGRVLLDLARARSLLSSQGSGGGYEAGREAGAAIELLYRVRAIGLFKSPIARDRLAYDADFEPLRTRNEFRSLLADVSFPDDPFAH
jgi:serine/threonine-protein kinase